MLSYCCLSYSQSDFFLKANQSSKLKFQLVGNLIIIPLKVNNVELSFVLDTGVKKAILFNLDNKTTLNLKNTQTIFLQGLGANGKVKAIKSEYNRFQIGDAVALKKDLYVLLDGQINFTKRLGVPVHGIIGFDVFKDFVVEINYAKAYIRLHKHSAYSPKTSKKWRTVPLQIIQQKPYVSASVALGHSSSSEQKRVKLLIDTGSSDALWLFQDSQSGLQPNPSLQFHDFLGAGLSGLVFGQRSLIKAFSFANYTLNNVNVAFPDTLAINSKRLVNGRNGSLGGHILKRFNVFFNYRNQTLQLKKNRHFKARFTYNNSGLIIEYKGKTLVAKEEKTPLLGAYNQNENSNFNTIRINSVNRVVLKEEAEYHIVSIHKNSNAYNAGLRIGDVIISINGKKTATKGLSKVLPILHNPPGTLVRVTISRNGILKSLKFRLENRLKQERSSKKYHSESN